MSDLAISTQSGLMPALSISDAVDRYNALVEFTKAVMKPGKDYGVIPGTGDKPTLLKPGAEKLCSLFGLVPEFETVSDIVDFENGLFYFHYKCKLSRDGFPVGEGEGSANSKEKKYRYRNIPEWKASDEEKETALRIETRKSKAGNEYKMLVIENLEPFDLINTLQKMAQKRALVAAILIAANASEFFTQDIEDMATIEGQFVEEPQPEPEKTKSKPDDKPTSNGKRPYLPETIREKIPVFADNYGDFEPTPKQRSLLHHGLELCFAGNKEAEDQLHTVLFYLTGLASIKDVSGPELKALLENWLNIEQDPDTQEYSIDPMAAQEAQAIFTEALAGEGQKALL